MEYKIYFFCQSCKTYVDENLNPCNVCNKNIYCNNCKEHINICVNCTKDKLNDLFSRNYTTKKIKFDINRLKFIYKKNKLKNK